MKTNLMCPKCGNDLILRNGTKGSFYGCINYYNIPKCLYTQEHDKQITNTKATKHLDPKNQPLEHIFVENIKIKHPEVSDHCDLKIVEDLTEIDEAYQMGCYRKHEKAFFADVSKYAVEKKLPRRRVSSGSLSFDDI